MGTKTKPILSIIIPFYNSSRFLKSLQQTLAQFEDNCEIIFINDASSIEEKKKLEEYAKEQGWLVLHNKQNQGPGCSRNLGIQQAGGEYLVFLDADDLLSGNTRDAIVSVLRTHKPDVLLFDFEMIKGDKNNHYSMLTHKPEGSVPASYALAHCRSMTAGKCYKTGFIKKYGIKFGNEKRHEDTVFTKTALSYAKNVYYLPKPLYKYVVRADSLVGDSKNDSLEPAFIAYSYIQRQASNRFPNALEYVYINEVIISSILHLLKVKLSKKEFISLCNRFDLEQPGWTNNPYLAKASIRYQLIAKLTQYRCYYLLKFMMFLETIVRRILGVH